MKLPALWLALFFALGIAADELRAMDGKLWLTAGVVLFAFGLLLLRWKKMAPAWVLALATWTALGGLAGQLERAAVPSGDVARLIASGAIDTSEPLRWRGRLRDDPIPLPWGERYVIDLEGVETAGKQLAVRGGLRLSYFRGRGDVALPALRAGDRVEALALARVPRNFLDPGAFDERGFLARQNIELIGALRSPALIIKLGTPPLTLGDRLARARGSLLENLDRMFSGQAEKDAILRAMLLGDRNFVNADISQAFQKTGAYHVLVVAGLHVGALALFVFWLGRLLRLPAPVTTVVTLLILAGYVGVVQDRPPILRAALMAAIFLFGGLLFRRVHLLNSVALAALILLVARPSELFDASYQLSFLAVGVIAGLGLPWIDRTSRAYRMAFDHLGDVTRDRAHPPRAAQLRLDLRNATVWLSSRIPAWLASRADAILRAPMRFGLRLWEVALLSLCLQCGMMTLMAAYFHRVSLAGPASNVPAVILTALIVPVGFLALALSYVGPVWSAIPAKLAGGLVGCLLATVNWFSRWPRASWRIPTPPAWLQVAFFVVLTCLIAMAWRAAERLRARSPLQESRPPRRVAEWLAMGTLAILGGLVATHPFPPRLEKGKLEATVLDVGQGDSIFVAFPDRRTMLIDGGGAAGAEHLGGYRTGIDIGEQVVSPYLWARGVKRLDVVVLTHAHHDHIDGLRAVLGNFHVGQLWVGRPEDTRAFLALLEEAKTRHVSIVWQHQGKRFNWDGILGEILWPEDTSAVESASNDDSMVLRLADSKVRFLLTGDIERNVENRLLEEHEPLAADFLKVPHHGSNTSSTGRFLDAVSPRVAAISVGRDNPYGHPGAEAVARYEKRGIRLLRTDRDGAVTALTDGRALEVHAFAKAGSH